MQEITLENELKSLITTILTEGSLIMRLVVCKALIVIGCEIGYTELINLVNSPT